MMTLSWGSPATPLPRRGCAHPPGWPSTARDRPTARSPEGLLAEFPEWLGSHPLQVTGGRPELPILIKLIDAKQDLSVQVHPDDDYAPAMENGQRGKTEMWYVLDAEDGAAIVYGFHHAVTKQECPGELPGRQYRTPAPDQIPRAGGGRILYARALVHAILAGALSAGDP